MTLNGHFAFSFHYYKQVNMGAPCPNVELSLLLRTNLTWNSCGTVETILIIITVIIIRELSHNRLDDKCFLTVDMFVYFRAHYICHVTSNL